MFWVAMKILAFGFITFGLALVVLVAYWIWQAQTGRAES